MTERDAEIELALDNWKKAAQLLAEARQSLREAEQFSRNASDVHRKAKVKYLALMEAAQGLEEDDDVHE